MEQDKTKHVPDAGQDASPAPPAAPVTPVRQSQASDTKTERHPVLLGILLVFLLYLFVGGCQGVMNEGRPANAPKYTPRPSYAPRSTPRTTPTPTPHPVPSYRVGTVSPTGDPYHVEDYVHPDDFYYEYWDDFSDYEEAEEYWEEHH